MDTRLAFIVLLRCWVVVSRPSRSLSFSMVFSGGTQLLVDVEEGAADCDEDELHLQRHHKTAGSGPSVQILSSVPLPLDAGSPHLLLCVLTGLNSPLQDVLWWVNDTAVTSSGAVVSRMRSEGGGAYSATSVWEVPAADWRSKSAYWCGTIQEGREYKQKLCSEV